MSESTLCHCGRPLHYGSPWAAQRMATIVAQRGELIDVTVKGVTYLVQRHFIALHGLNAADLPKLGFEVKR